MNNLRTRLSRVAPRGGVRVVSQLATTPELRIHESEVSKWLSGVVIAQIKMDAMLAALESLEDLHDNYPVKIDMRDIQNVRAALDRLAAKKAEELAVLSIPASAVAPFQRDPRGPAQGGENVQIPAAASLLSQEGQ